MPLGQNKVSGLEGILIPEVNLKYSWVFSKCPYRAVLDSGLQNRGIPLYADQLQALSVKYLKCLKEQSLSY